MHGARWKRYGAADSDDGQDFEPGTFCSCMARVVISSAQPDLHAGVMLENGWRVLVPLAVVVVGRRARFLSLSGCIAAMLVGSLVVLRGWDVTAMLLLFFALGSVATKVKQKEKEEAMPYPETEAEAQARALKQRGGDSKPKHAHEAKVKRQGRDAWQVMATGLVPALICLLQPLFPDLPAGAEAVSSSSFLSTPPARPLWFLTYLAFVATCCGDTLASEIGMLSRQTPLMLWTRSRVSRGVDGGMTLLGTAASVAGGAIIGACAGTLFDVYLGAVYGCIGSLFDSILGTFLQSSQYCSQPARRVSPSPSSSPVVAAARDADGFVDATRLDAPLPLTPAAWKHLNNAVNVLSSLLAAALAVAVQHIQLAYGVQLLPFLALMCALLLLTVTPGMRPTYALGGGAVITALWCAVYSSLPREHLWAAGPLYVAYALWRM